MPHAESVRIRIFEEIICEAWVCKLWGLNVIKHGLKISYIFWNLNHVGLVTLYVQICLWLILGGEDKTIQFMEGMSLTADSGTPLLKEAYAYGVVEHPFPLNCFLRDWHLGPDFYQAVKIGIVQYVCDVFWWLVLLFPCSLFSRKWNLCFFLFFTKTPTFPDDTENDLCIAGNDPPVFWGLWRGEVWMEIWVRFYWPMPSIMSMFIMKTNGNDTKYVILILNNKNRSWTQIKFYSLFGVPIDITTYIITSLFPYLDFS